MDEELHADKVTKIKRELQLDASLSMPAAIKEANERMGVTAPHATLMSQADELLSVLGLAEPSNPLPRSPSPPMDPRTLLNKQNSIDRLEAGSLAV